MVVLTQYEVNVLMSEIQHPSSAVILHNYEPRTTESMHSIESAITAGLRSDREWLDLSPQLRRRLHFFAGQLYFDTYDDYCDAFG